MNTSLNMHTTKYKFEIEQAIDNNCNIAPLYLVQPMLAFQIDNCEIPSCKSIIDHVILIVVLESKLIWVLYLSHHYLYVRHPGRHTINDELRSSHYWPYMPSDVHVFVANCTRRAKKHRLTPKKKLFSPTSLMRFLATILLEHLPITEQGNRKVLEITDLEFKQEYDTLFGHRKDVRVHCEHIRSALDCLFWYICIRRVRLHTAYCKQLLFFHRWMFWSDATHNNRLRSPN